MLNAHGMTAQAQVNITIQNSSSIIRPPDHAH
jgi:hypothetical protein